MKGFVTKTPIKADKNGNVPTTINLLKAGSWNTPWHGDFELTGEDLEEMAGNFTEGVGLVVEDNPRAPINEGHNVGGKATGWMTRLYVQAVNGTAGLFADVEWTPAGEQAIRDKEYAYISPEFNPRGWPWEDPEQEFTFVDNVLTGAALTNIPLFKKLKPITASRIPPSKAVTASQGGEANKSNQGEPMKPEDILAKPVSDRTDEEKTFLSEHSADLTDEQKTQLDTETSDAEAQAKADQEAAEQAAKDKEAADRKAADEEAARVEASATKGVQISQADLDKLRADAEAGRAASETLRKKEADEIVSGAIKAGQIKSGDKDKWVGQLLASKGDSRTALESLIAGLPKNEQLGKELGDAGKDAKVEASVEVHNRVVKIQADARAEGKTVAYAAARKQVLDADKELKAQFEQEEA